MEEQKICFLTKLIPYDIYEEVGKKSTNNMQDAANALQWHLYEGLCQNYGKNVHLINILPVGSYPQYYADAFVKEGRFETSYGDGNKNVGFCNIKLLRKYNLPSKIYRALMQEFRDNDSGILYVYTISSEFMEAVSKFKKLKPGVKVCAIIADLPNMSSLSSKNGIIKRVFIDHLADKSYKNINCIDGFVLLTEQMADNLHINKPYCVMEGISTATEDFGEKQIDYHSKIKVILYSGTLHKRFGVMNLVNAFEKIESSEYNLVLCGSGDSEAEIIKAAARDPRIHFCGQLPRKEILELQKTATVLVNPRQNNEEFTKYSFPSKVMEYLSSGIPVVAYKLDGVPLEYEDYLFYVEGDAISDLSRKLIEVCEMNPSDRRKHGEKGREFVLNQKNSIVQTSKILRMVESL